MSIAGDVGRNTLTAVFTFVVCVILFILFTYIMFKFVIPQIDFRAIIVDKVKEVLA